MDIFRFKDSSDYKKVQRSLSYYWLLKKRTAGLVLLILGFFALLSPVLYKKFVGWQGEIANKSAWLFQPSKEASSFEDEGFGPIRADPALLELPEYKEGLPTRVVIPDLEINLEITPARVKEGLWEIPENKAAFGLGTQIPGKPGNTVIFGHAREGIFLPLRKAKKGVRVYLLTKDNWYEYEIKETLEVAPNQLEVIKPTSDETLTLFTCSSFADAKRFIAIAKRKGGE